MLPCSVKRDCGDAKSSEHHCFRQLDTGFSRYFRRPDPGQPGRVGSTFPAPTHICLQRCPGLFVYSCAPCIFVCNGALAYLFTSTDRSQHGMLSLLQMEYMQPTRRPADRVTERSLDGQSGDSPIDRFNGRPAVRHAARAKRHRDEGF
jgi:hypothetical protein